MNKLIKLKRSLDLLFIIIEKKEIDKEYYILKRQSAHNKPHIRLQPFVYDYDEYDHPHSNFATSPILKNIIHHEKIISLNLKQHIW